MLESLRKYKLDYCDLPTMLWNVAVGLRVLTLNVDSRHTEGIPFFYYVLTVVTAGCHFYAFLICMMLFVFVRCPQTGDLVAAMVIFSLGISSAIGPVKLFYMFLNATEIREIATNLLECDSQTEPGSRFYVNLQTSLRTVKKRALIYWTVIISNGFLYLLKPIAMPGKNLPENYLIIYGLEPMFESPNYEIACAIQTAGVFYICYVAACVTAYFIVIAGYTESQMLALSEEMLHLWLDAVKEAETELEIENINEYEPGKDNEDTINKYIEKRLKDTISRHALVINLYHSIEDVFRGAIATGFLMLILSLIAELLGKLENTYLQMPFAIMQVAMDCFTGQRLMDASMVFEEAVYACKWERFNRNNMKMVLVILMNAQKTMTLSAGGIAMLSFSCMMSIGRAIYSTYTTLSATI